MGLDCYVQRKQKDIQTGESDDQEIWYGRKENEIHGWMQRHSGVASEDFNCVPLPLTTELLDQLETSMLAGLMTPTKGFFFGPDNAVDNVMTAAKELIKVSREALEAGEEIYYTSWW